MAELRSQKRSILGTITTNWKEKCFLRPYSVLFFPVMLWQVSVMCFPLKLNSQSWTGFQHGLRENEGPAKQEEETEMHWHSEDGWCKGRWFVWCSRNYVMCFYSGLFFSVASGCTFIFCDFFFFLICPGTQVKVAYFFISVQKKRKNIRTFQTSFCNHALFVCSYFPWDVLSSSLAHGDISLGVHCDQASLGLTGHCTHSHLLSRQFVWHSEGFVRRHIFLQWLNLTLDFHCNGETLRGVTFHRWDTYFFSVLDTGVCPIHWLVCIKDSLQLHIIY